MPSLSSSTRQCSRPNRAARRNALSSSGVAVRIRHQGSTDVAVDPDIRDESLARDVAALDSEIYPKLLEGYLLDAIERLDLEPATDGQLAEFVASTSGAARSRRPSAGLGDDIRLRGSGIIGSGLEYEGELIQLSAFSSTGELDRAATRITRPSRRR